MPALRAVFMGSDAFSVPVLKRLIDDGPKLVSPVDTVMVVTRPARPSGRGRIRSVNPVEATAGAHGIPVLMPERLVEREAMQNVLDAQPDLIVVASYGQFLPGSLLEAPRHRCLNLHPSLLPRFRGPTPVEGALLAGVKETGTTVMLMAKKMDAGPILAQERVPVTTDETAGELEQRLATLSARLLLETLPPWTAGEIAPRDQDEAEATYTNLTTKTDGRIDWSLPAELIARRVRAFNPWPVAQTHWNGRPVRFLLASALEGSAEPGQVVSLDGASLLVGTGQGMLRVREMQLAGGRASSPGALVRGHPELLRARFVTEDV